jgi:hypothetical protein
MKKMMSAMTAKQRQNDDVVADLWAMTLSEPVNFNMWVRLKLEVWA